MYSAVAAFASSWLLSPQPSLERPLRFLLGTLESLKQYIKLAHILLQDIDAEYPGLRLQLAPRKDSVAPHKPLFAEFRMNTLEYGNDTAVSDTRSSDSLEDTTNWNLDDYLCLDTLT